MSTVAVDGEDASGPAGRPWVALAELLAWFGRLSPAVYLLTALPTVLFLTVLVPPFQVPDETNHFRREVHLLRGEVVGHDIAAPGFSGARLPRSVDKVAEAFSYLIGHSDARFSPGVMHEAAATPWNWSDRDFTSFANTVIYPPFFYLPSVAALAAARGLGWNPLDAYGLARLTNGLLAVGIAALAIGRAGRGRAVLFVVLSFPTTLYLFASVSQDGLLIACSALAMALCSHAADLDRPLTTPERIGVALLLGAVVAARPPYVPMVAVLVGPLVRCSGPRIGARLRAAVPATGALAIAACWVLFGAKPAQTPMRLEAGVSIPDQLLFCLHHPAAFPTALLNTVSDRIGTHVAQAIAVLGWSETLFPPLYYDAAAVALAVAVALSLGGRRGAPSPRRGSALLGAAVLAFIGLHAALYLQWTPVGATFVDGFQGRYLLPAAMLLAVALPAFGGAGPTVLPPAGSFAARCRTAAGLALWAFAAASHVRLPHEVFLRYYG